MRNTTTNRRPFIVSKGRQIIAYCVTAEEARTKAARHERGRVAGAPAIARKRSTMEVV